MRGKSPNDCLIRECQQGGWKARCFALEVGCSTISMQSLQLARERGGDEPCTVPPTQQKEPQGGCSSREESHGAA